MYRRHCKHIQYKHTYTPLIHLFIFLDNNAGIHVLYKYVHIFIYHADMLTVYMQGNHRCFFVSLDRLSGH